MWQVQYFLTCGPGRKGFSGAQVNAPRFAWHLQYAGASDPGPLSVSTDGRCSTLGRERQAVDVNAFEVRL